MIFFYWEKSHPPWVYIMNFQNKRKSVIVSMKPNNFVTNFIFFFALSFLCCFFCFTIFLPMLETLKITNFSDRMKVLTALWPCDSGLDNCIAYKSFTVQNFTWSLEFVFLKIFWTRYKPGSNLIRNWSIERVFVIKFSLSSINQEMTPLHEATLVISKEFGYLKNSDSIVTWFSTRIKHVHLINK